MSRSLRFALVILALSALAPILPAQVATGNIIGRITDASGAAAGGVEVTALHTTTGVSSRAPTDDEGIYRLLYLPPATYT